MNSGQIKILIADDHSLIREGLKRIISFEENLTVIGEAENGEMVMLPIKQNKPDVMLLDMNMPLMSGIEVLKKIKELSNDIKVIMLTVENDSSIIHEAIDMGADGYMLKDSAGTEIVNAIRTVYKGEKYIDKSLVSLLFSGIRNSSKKTSCVLDVLSKREVEVLMKISEGFSNKEIGEQLYLSEKTVKNYATSIFRKLQVNDRVQATITAIQNKIESYYRLRFGEGFNKPA
jgi:two-component system, NarL family, response regulator DegU